MPSNAEPSSPPVLSPSVALLVGRWGRWPGWMPLFMNCVERNPTIHFLMLGDEPPTDTAMKLTNVKFHQMSMVDLLRRVAHIAQDVGRVSIAPNEGHVDFAAGLRAGGGSKLNDFKPLWGEACSDLLAGYEWYAQ